MNDYPTWTGAAEYVWARVRAWDVGYYKSTKPVDLKIVKDPNSDEKRVFSTRYWHSIAFSTNEWRWLVEVLNYELELDPENKMSGEIHRAFTKALTLAEKRDVRETDRFKLECDFRKEEVTWLNNLLSRLRYGKPTFAEESAQSKDIEKGDW